jgi:hypothetical protein
MSTGDPLKDQAAPQTMVPVTFAQQAQQAPTPEQQPEQPAPVHVDTGGGDADVTVNQPDQQPALGQQEEQQGSDDE